MSNAQVTFDAHPVAVVMRAWQERIAAGDVPFELLASQADSGGART